MSSSIAGNELAEQYAGLVRRVAEIERRLRNSEREGKVVDANPAEGLYKVELRAAEGDKPAYETGWLKVEALSAGGVKIQADPVIDQIVMVKSESGDLTDAKIAMSSFNTDNQRPHDKNGEFVITVGDGYRLVIAQDGSETTNAKSREYNTDGDVIFNTQGKVYFN